MADGSPTLLERFKRGRKLVPSAYVRALLMGRGDQSEEGRSLKRMRSSKIALLLVFAAFISGVLTYGALTETPPLGNDPQMVIWLLNIDLIILLLLVAMIAKRIVSVWSGRKRGLAGSHLHVRLVYIFSILAAAPAIIMTVFSAFFFHYGVQTWFSERVQTAVTESQAVAEAYLEEHKQVIRADTLAMAGDLDREATFLLGNNEALERIIGTQSVLRNLPEVIIIDSAQRVMARSGLTFTIEMFNIPQYAWQQANDGEVVVMTGENEDRIRALVKLRNFVDSYLFVGRMVDPRVLKHLADTRKAVSDYEALQTSYSGLQVTVTGIFVVVGLLLVLAAIWFGLVLARQLVTPISQLINVTERVRAGDLTARVAEQDTLQEFDFLARAFNRMTTQIQGQRNDLIEANRQLDRRRHFTETVLAGVSSGVLGLDDTGIINLANQSAAELLGLERESLSGLSLADLVPGTRDMLAEAYSKPGKMVQGELAHEPKEGSKRKIFLVRLVIEQIDGGEKGAIVTFDDITALQAAQRKAAWGDVARRIAHEIKNPLTPIQLSAERLRRKYKDEVQSDPEIFSQCIDTIVKHVEDIGHMVNEFSSFARMPEAKMRAAPLYDTAYDAYLLQKQAHPDIEFECTDLGNAKNMVHHDPQLLRQAITNLLQNAVESLQAQEGKKKKKITLHVLNDAKHGGVIAISDNGPGLPDQEHEDQLLEPYVTRKEKGTGLGLAIVKKIIEEHRGQILLAAPQWLSAHKGWPKAKDALGGATVVLVIPDKDS